MLPPVPLSAASLSVSCAVVNMARPSVSAESAISVSVESAVSVSVFVMSAVRDTMFIWLPETAVIIFVFLLSAAVPSEDVPDVDTDVLLPDAAPEEQPEAFVISVSAVTLIVVIVPAQDAVITFDSRSASNVVCISLSSSSCPFNTFDSRYSVVPAVCALSDRLLISSSTLSILSFTSSSWLAMDASSRVASSCPSFTVSPLSTSTSFTLIPAGTITSLADPSANVPVPTTVVLMLPVDAVADCTVISAARFSVARLRNKNPAATTVTNPTDNIPAQNVFFFLNFLTLPVFLMPPIQDGSLFSLF